MPSRNGDNNIVKIIEAAGKKKAAENELKVAVLKARVTSELRRQESREQIKNQTGANILQERAKNQMTNPQMFTPEQQYLARRFRDENPLAALRIPEEGQDPAINMPKEEVIQDPKTKTYAVKQIGEDRAGDLQLQKIDQMISEGKKVHPAVLAVADKIRESKLRKESLGSGGKANMQNFNATTKARQEFLNRPEVKDYVTISSNIGAMDGLLKGALSGNQQNQLALDQGLITMFNKMTDPQSVVRESEYARTPENLPLVNRINGAIEKIYKGGAGMTNDDRKALVLGAKIIANARGARFNETLQEYRDLAGRYKFDPELVTRGMKDHTEFDVDPPDATATNPETGEVMELRGNAWVPAKKKAA